MKKINIFKVCIIRLDIKYGIELFDIQSYFFKTKELAIEFAFLEAKKYFDECSVFGRDTELDYNDEGRYVWPHHDYDYWNNMEIYVKSDVMDFTKNMIYREHFTESINE